MFFLALDLLLLPLLSAIFAFWAMRAARGRITDMEATIIPIADSMSEVYAIMSFWRE